MNKSISDYIDELLLNSGLFPSKRKLEWPSNNFDFTNETILITGAAGTIGSELSKQLIKCKYKKLILVDIAESPLYDLTKDLEFEDTTNVEIQILNITDEESLKFLFKNHKPTLIFHTAAYKHVPLMESNPFVALKLNVLGTKHIADLSVEYKVKKFVFMSTDKAVNPISVMGITKFIAEKYLIELSQKSKTFFAITRFGNILGSNGSVLPLFIKQLETTNSITLTDDKVSRYFIDKYKACSLILKIATLDHLESNIFTFNMGKPIFIKELAERLVLMQGVSKGKIEIKTIGLRPGEKLNEDIVSNDEELVNTNLQDILIVRKKTLSEIKKIDFTDLLNVTPQMSINEIKLVLRTYLNIITFFFVSFL
ncbi:MAG: polysaccharide biosynthesis protein [Flaviramulus sp.]|nr:polysaccharide biosynthesis protein [Flaviramulus sp.]NNC50679.1 polysaccharide biosynthesis protein [Flaviramulus sp.]